MIICKKLCVLYIYLYIYYFPNNFQYLQIISKYNTKVKGKWKKWKKSPPDTTNGNITNWKQRRLPAPGTEIVLLLLQFTICTISLIQWSRILLSLASGKYPFLKKWQLQCLWGSGLIKSCNPIKFHQTSLRLIFKMNKYLTPRINICWCSSIWALFRIYGKVYFSKYIFCCIYLREKKKCTQDSICF